MAYKFSEYQEKWLTDLETTSAEQCTEGLANGSGGNCCLGRYYESRGANYVQDAVTEICSYNGNSAALGKLALRELRLHSRFGKILIENVSPEWRRELKAYGHLTELNDNLRWSFKKIAQFIRANPEAVFTGE